MEYKRVVINILAGFVIFYFLLGIMLFFSQRSMIYYPFPQDFESCSGFSDYEKINHNGTRFYYKHNEGSESVIVYYHGNAGSACDRSMLKSFFESFNSSVIFVEYAGYSNDVQSPSKELILRDVDNVDDYVRESFDKVLVFGLSIGSGVASYQASLGNVDSLIAVNSFSRLSRVAQSKYPIYPAFILLSEEYDNAEWLRGFQGEILLVHGDKDKIIPYRFSKELFDEIDCEKKEYILIEGRNHNNIWGSAEFRNKIAGFINKI